jgi:hypothetical protein
MTTEQEKHLALDIYRGAVFTDRNCPPDMIGSVFMVFTFMEREDLERLKEKIGESGVIYEYLDKAGPRTVNGLPMFMSMNVLTTEEAARVIEMVKSIADAVKKVGIPSAG